MTRRDCGICGKKFTGTTSDTRYKAHCKTEHLEFYRTSIRLLKDPKLINREAYLKRKKEKPDVVEVQQTMARMRRKARNEQIRSLQNRSPPEPPAIPEEPFIDEFNPYHVASTEFGIFVGVTYAQLLEHSIIVSLERYESASAGLSPRVASLLKGALVMARRDPIATLARHYHNYRQLLTARATRLYTEYQLKKGVPTQTGAVNDGDGDGDEDEDGSDSEDDTNDVIDPALQLDPGAAVRKEVGDAVAEGQAVGTSSEAAASN
ncbi:uncharacterized protein H6S33_005562 [Morchella sextelata]|uniref:uncharacterized protein n=1 Tax=Morchella sextelata TaxID=1174677 RepID=UPI001D04C972|nr:uncharacterized protein H6S33_005562 [Morchella sextelata]KAH0613676.1 hypothetical protein H6S33_005562 [Morchella sextelata]